MSSSFFPFSLSSFLPLFPFILLWKLLPCTTKRFFSIASYYCIERSLKDFEQGSFFTPEQISLKPIDFSRRRKKTKKKLFLKIRVDWRNRKVCRTLFLLAIVNKDFLQSNIGNTTKRYSN